MFMFKQGGRIRWKEFISSLAATDYCTEGMYHSWLVHFVYNSSYASLFAMNKDKQICLPSIKSIVTNNKNSTLKNEANKLSKLANNPFQSLHVS